MILHSRKSKMKGAVEIPASKSHTIRALAIATLAHGRSEIRNPLDSADTRACVTACRALGAEIVTGENWQVTGTGGVIPSADNVIDVANSGTTLYTAIGMAALSGGVNVFTGDGQTRRRPCQPLLDAVTSLGASAESTRHNGCAPVIVRGQMKGGYATLACPTSQYLSSLLISCPLATGETNLTITELNEQPYVQMTLDWLTGQNIAFSHENFRQFTIPGGQRYEGFSERIKADFSSATFFLCAAAITGSELTLVGLDMNDSQGDKAVVDMLEQMGAKVTIGPNAVTIRGGSLKGVELDLNATPDALPALAITGCFAEGETRLVNVPQARLKETDRIAAMHQAIRELGGKSEEMPDGLIIQGRGLAGGEVHGHADHRIVMACAVAGLVSTKPVTVDTAEAVGITFPTFVQLMTQCGAQMETRT